MLSECPACKKKLFYIRRSKRKKVSGAGYEFNCGSCGALLEKQSNFKQVIMSVFGAPIIFSIFDIWLGRDVIEKNLGLVTFIFVLLTLLFWVGYEHYKLDEKVK